MELQTDKFACLMVMFLGRSKTHNNYVPQFQFSLICFTRMNFFLKKAPLKAKLLVASYLTEAKITTTMFHPI